MEAASLSPFWLSRVFFLLLLLPLLLRLFFSQFHAFLILRLWSRRRRRRLPPCRSSAHLLMFLESQPVSQPLPVAAPLRLETELVLLFRPLFALSFLHLLLSPRLCKSFCSGLEPFLPSASNFRWDRRIACSVREGGSAGRRRRRAARLGPGSSG